MPAAAAEATITPAMVIHTHHADGKAVVPEGTIYTWPDASADPPGRSRKLPDLRHGAGARSGIARCAAQTLSSRT